MSVFQQYVGKVISIEVAGARHREGVLVDFGPDIIVVFDNKSRYCYIPVAHLQHFELSPRQDLENAGNFQNKPINSEVGSISFGNIMQKAKDILLEIYVTGQHPIYGYIYDIQNDYVLFNSPVYKTMAIHINHIKWLALTNRSQTLYLKSREDIHVQPTLSAFAAATFEQQLSKMIGKIIILDMGTEPNKTGLVAGISSDFMELISANEEKHLFNINHIKMFHI